MKMGRETEKDLRWVLQEELSSRCRKNPSYSLRAFAKLLDISPAALSALLNGKRPITHKMKERLGLKLGFSIKELSRFNSKPHGNTKRPQESAAHFQQITIDIFSIISEPHHYSILELMKTRGFRLNSRWIAGRIGRTPSEVNFALERLERAGLLVRDSRNQLVDSTEGFSTDIREGLSSEAQRHFQMRSLQNAIASIEAVAHTERDNTSITMAIDPRDMPRAKEMIKAFRRQFCHTLEASPQLDEVYQLTIAFNPVTKLAPQKRAKL